MSEINGFINLTQLRRMNQQTLKPIIQQIESEISKIKKESQFLKQQSQKSKSIYENNKKFQQYMCSDQQAMREVKFKLQQLRDEDLKLMLTMRKQVTFMNEQLLSLKRQRSKYEQIISKQKKQNEKVLNQLTTYQQWMDEKVQKMNQQYLSLKSDTLGMTTGLSRNYEHAAQRITTLQRQLVQNKQLQRQKNQTLELYMNQRQETKLKLIQLENNFHLFAPLEQIDYLRQCQTKELQMTKEEISQMLENYLPERIKNMLPLIESKVKEIDAINSQIQDIKFNVFESEQEMTHFKQTTQSLQSNFRKEVKQINTTFTKNIEKLQKDVQLALIRDQKQTQSRKMFESSITKTIQTFVKEENQKIYKIIQEETNEKLANQIQQQELKLSQHQAIMNQRCSEVKQISQGIEKLLGNYSSRIVKIRSDTQLFKNQMLKELKSIDQNKRETKERFEDMGKIIASLVEILLASLSMETNLDVANMKQDNFAFATYNDGLVYQTMPLFSQNGEKNTLNQITYRRKPMNIQHLRRSLLTSMVNLVDKVYEMSPYLQWKNYKPSNFFLEEIYKNYQIQAEKHGGLQDIEIRDNKFLVEQKQRQSPESEKRIFIPFKNSTIERNQSSNFRRSKVIEKAYSLPRKEDPLSNTIDSQILWNKENPPMAQQLEMTIDEGVEVDISSGDSFNVLQKENLSIQQRPIKTIHEIHGRDANNNRIFTRSFHQNGCVSLIKDDFRTLDYAPQSAGSYRKKYMSKSKKDIGKDRYRHHQFLQTDKNKNNDIETFMSSRTSRRATSIGTYNIC